MTIADRLRGRLPHQRAFAVGISAEDLKDVALTRDLKDDIVAAINSDFVADIRLGLFFAEQLVRPGHDRQFERELLEAAIGQFESRESGIKDGCLALIILVGQDLSIYRQLMLSALRNHDPMVRKRALIAYATYADSKEFEPLETFETDGYLSEERMGSHLVYELRNHALSTIEHAIGQTFTKAEMTEVLKEGTVAFWWDWKPFHNWKRSWWRRLST